MLLKVRLLDGRFGVRTFELDPDSDGRPVGLSLTRNFGTCVLCLGRMKEDVESFR